MHWTPVMVHFCDLFNDRLTTMNSVCINNQWFEGTGESLTSLNPLNNLPLWQKHSASREQVLKAVAIAKKAQLAWALVSLDERISVVERFAELLTKHATSLAKIISAETGKPDWEAATEVTAMTNKVAISIRAQQQRAGQWQKPNLQLQHRAHGVMAVFGPYNFPGHLPNGHIVPALLAGNAIVFKPSEHTPWVAERTIELWIEAGLPAGVINLVQGGKAVGEALAEADIDGLLFTGSSHVGSLLHRQLAGRPEVLLALEMGGNNPLIVDENVNIAAAVNIILQSAYLSAGQRCTCARRLIVIGNEQYTLLMRALTDAIDRIIVDAHDAQPEAFMGPVINDKTSQDLLSFEKQLSQQGATVIRSMTPDTEGSNLLKPGLVDVTLVEKTQDEEWFGPLLQVQQVGSFAEAIEQANCTRFGLAAGLISDNPQHQQDFLALIKAGVVSINKPTAGASSEMPFGGVGASGNHRPSAFYAADYCAWPQAQSIGDETQHQTQPLARGLR